MQGEIVTALKERVKQLELVVKQVEGDFADLADVRRDTANSYENWKFI